MDPVSTGAIFKPVGAALGRHLWRKGKDSLWGTSFEAELGNVLALAWGAAAEVACAQADGHPDPQDLSEVAAELARAFSLPLVSEALVVSLFDSSRPFDSGTHPDFALSLSRIDPTTCPVDLPTLLIGFLAALHSEVTRAASRPDSPLFNLRM